MRSRIIEIFCSPDDRGGARLRDKLFRLPLRDVVLRFRDRRNPDDTWYDDHEIGLRVDGVPVPIPPDGDIDTDVLEVACSGQ